MWYLAETLATAGRIDEARRTMERVHAIESAWHGTESTLARLAEVGLLALSGDLDRAVALLPSVGDAMLAKDVRGWALFARITDRPDVERLIEEAEARVGARRDAAPPTATGHRP